MAPSAPSSPSAPERETRKAARRRGTATMWSPLMRSSSCSMRATTPLPRPSPSRPARMGAQRAARAAATAREELAAVATSFPTAPHLSGGTPANRIDAVRSSVCPSRTSNSGAQEVSSSTSAATLIVSAVGSAPAPPPAPAPCSGHSTSKSACRKERGLPWSAPSRKTRATSKRLMLDARAPAAHSAKGMRISWRSPSTSPRSVSSLTIALPSPPPADGTWPSATDSMGTAPCRENTRWRTAVSSARLEGPRAVGPRLDGAPGRLAGSTPHAPISNSPSTMREWVAGESGRERSTSLTASSSTRGGSRSLRSASRAPGRSMGLGCSIHWMSLACCGHRSANAAGGQEEARSSVRSTALSIPVEKGCHNS
mmetsp:Transcript_24439/g.77174  ORF Transcript_24439/g.77174 Transcript_24439/m.77174 type:complete len:369 (-) Transcript_24439:206-1312(-)